MVFALELSSYQLESIQSFHAEGAAFLNLTPDHLARHGHPWKRIGAPSCGSSKGRPPAISEWYPQPIPSGGRMHLEADGRPGSDGPNARPGAMAKGPSDFMARPCCTAPSSGSR